MTTNRSITRRIHGYLAEHGGLPGKTKGDIREALNLPPVGERERAKALARHGALAA